MRTPMLHMHTHTHMHLRVCIKLLGEEASRFPMRRAGANEAQRGMLDVQFPLNAHRTLRCIKVMYGACAVMVLGHIRPVTNPAAITGNMHIITQDERQRECAKKARRNILAEERV